MRIETLAVHAGCTADRTINAVAAREGGIEPIDDRLEDMEQALLAV
jgi:hypothetical protein